MLASQIKSAELYTLLLSEFAKAREALIAFGAGEKEIAFYISSTAYDKELSLHLTIGHYGTYSVDVKGKSLGDLVSEAVNRLAFANRQKNLQLEHQVEPPPAPTPVADAEFSEEPFPQDGEEVLQEQGAEPVDLPTVASDDEIPF